MRTCCQMIPLTVDCRHLLSIDSGLFPCFFHEGSKDIHPESARDVKLITDILQQLRQIDPPSLFLCKWLVVLFRLFGRLFGRLWLWRLLRCPGTGCLSLHAVINGLFDIAIDWLAGGIGSRLDFLIFFFLNI